ncbi:hypothetical protein AJ80_09448 [Polytolypa hystricis UAMH7299]|uniref:Amine oxidase domain-containing protein n=1 Tax=Polytolypa hystricis (strain UAMH7299) TaxID=1447883 RepID=A0A2B7WQK3_POLH7|nr:hypothetical protein AJ80_09448 [Polytolypa hystricis UAMH7299]
MPTKSKSNSGIQKVLIIGAGASGMSCAASLAKQPEMFDITVLERSNSTGGLATSLSLDSSRYGADWMNSTVQGGASTFRHTFQWFREYGYEPKPANLQIATGKGTDAFWTNVFPTSLLRKHEVDIQKFGHALKTMKWAKFVLWGFSLKTFARLFGLSTDFANKMLYPLVSLLLGTGNETKNIPCSLLQRIFNDPMTRIWEYDPVSFVRPVAMFTFPNMGLFHKDWTEGLRAKGVKIRLNTQAINIVQRNERGVVVETRLIDMDSRIDDRDHRDRTVTEVFDKLVLCTPGDEARRLLGNKATWVEKFVLGGARFTDDLTVTHTDSKYMQRHYETHFREELGAEPRSVEEEQKFAFARGELGRESGFRPMFFTHLYRQRRDKIEQAFDCTNLQYQFQKDPRCGEPPIPFENHVFQSHFLNAELKNFWTVDQIHEDSIIESMWWHQFAHRWQHYLRVVPGLRLVNGKNNTFYAGSWTFVNIYEIACVSGIAVAYRLGAPYEKFDDVAERYFAAYLSIAHGVKYEKGSGAIPIPHQQ